MTIQNLERPLLESVEQKLCIVISSKKSDMKMVMLKEGSLFLTFKKEIISFEQLQKSNIFLNTFCSKQPAFKMAPNVPASWCSYQV